MKHLTLIILSLLFISCGLSQTSEDDFIERVPPESVHIDPQWITKLTSDIQTNKIQNVHGLLIIKDDKLICEEYFGDFDRDRLQYTASVSKSFASALFGIAVDQGYFDDDIPAVLNKPVAELFPEYEKTIQRDRAKQGLQLKHILSMSAGFEWDEHTYPYSDTRNDCNRLNRSNDPMNFLFERMLVQKPGEAFYYNGGLSLCLSYLIEQYSDMSVVQFAEKYLFGPLDINDYQWETVANGLVDTDGGLHLKPIDQAKFGYLFLNKGNWKGQQIVSEEWVYRSTEMHIKNQNMPDYAYQWWGGHYLYANKPYSMYMASGHGGQKIVVMPDFNLVVVITQQVFNNPFGDLNFIVIMSEYILPAITNTQSKDQILEIHADQLRKYEGHYVLGNNIEFIDILVKDHSLIGVSNDGQTNTFIPVAENIFKTRIMDLIDLEIQFERDVSGNVVGLKTGFAFTDKYYHKQRQ